MKIYQEAGVPDGVINFVPGQGSIIGNIVLNHPDLAGIHFTGSTATSMDSGKLLEIIWSIIILIQEL
jgi:acyl-CoA reductase-like NAD-dependent aldehyde dehydrogenase